MIFIAGAQPKTEQYRLAETKYCFRCHNESRWILQKRRYFITLFFLPVVPVKTEYSYYCPICLNSETITGEKFEELLQSGAEAI
jgi:hypothetical protein